MNSDSNLGGWLYVIALVILGGGWELLRQPGTLFGLAMLALLVFVCR